MVSAGFPQKVKKYFFDDNDAFVFPFIPSGTEAHPILLICPTAKF